MKHPEKIYDVSNGMLSVARHYGGCTYNGKEYVYFPNEDVLIRKDCLPKKKLKTKPKQRENQPNLFD